MSSKAWRTGLVAVLALALGLRLVALDRFSYWLDEALQSYWLHGTWSFLWKSLKFDAFHPPLDYVVGRLLEALGPADWERKIPAVLWGVGTVAALGVLASRRAGRTAGLVTALLLAASPFHVRYSQELRPYSLGLFAFSFALLALDVHLGARTAWSWAGAFLSCLAALYSLYVSAIVLAVAAGALVATDAVLAEPARRDAARRFLRTSPVFVAALWVAYLPWWPVVVAASRRPPVGLNPPLTFARMGQTLSFFAFTATEGQGPGALGIFFGVLCAAGLVLALRRASTTFVPIWTIAGFAAIEIAGRLHPHVYATRRFLPAGLGLVVAAALAIARLIEAPERRFLGVPVLLVVLAADAASLRDYYAAGRADWRPAAAFLRSRMRPGDRLFAPGPYEALTVSYYLVGPELLFDADRGRRTSPEVVSLDGEPGRLGWMWTAGSGAWLLLRDDDSRFDGVRAWAGDAAATRFPTAERSTLISLDASRRDQLLAHPPWGAPSAVNPP